MISGSSSKFIVSKTWTGAKGSKLSPVHCSGQWKDKRTNFWYLLTVWKLDKLQAQPAAPCSPAPCCCSSDKLCLFPKHQVVARLQVHQESYCQRIWKAVEIDVWGLHATLVYIYIISYTQLYKQELNSILVTSVKAMPPMSTLIPKQSLRPLRCLFYLHRRHPASIFVCTRGRDSFTVFDTLCTSHSFNFISLLLMVSPRKT